jgi:hypothetical protein
MIAACSAARRPLARRRSKNEGVVGVRSGEQGAEVGVGADEHPALRAGRVDDDRVGRAGHADVSRTCTTSWPAARRSSASLGEIVVVQEPHAE